ERQGVQTVVPGELSLAEQVAAFRAARLVIGAHGTPMSNIVFCRPGSFVYELLPRHHVSSTVNRLAQTASVNYLADIFGPGGGGQGSGGVRPRCGPPGADADRPADRHPPWEETGEGLPKAHTGAPAGGGRGATPRPCAPHRGRGGHRACRTEGTASPWTCAL